MFGANVPDHLYAPFEVFGNFLLNWAGSIRFRQNLNDENRNYILTSSALFNLCIRKISNIRSAHLNSCKHHVWFSHECSFLVIAFFIEKSLSD